MSSPWSRRDFLKVAATAAALGPALGACSSDQQGAAAPRGSRAKADPSLPAPPSAEAWAARWIEPAEAASALQAQRPAHLLAGEVSVPSAVRRAVLHVTAHGIHETFLNGRRVGDLELTPGFTAYRSHLHVHTFDVTDLVRTGSNVLGAVLSDGWWRGRNGIVRRPDAYGPTTAYLAQLDVVHRDATHTTFGTGAGWRTTPSHILGADLIAGEIHDLRATIDGWAEPGTDRSSWSAVTVADHLFATLTPAVGPPTRCIRELPARSVTEIAPRRWVVDFGENTNGWIRLDDLGPAGTELTITYGEWVDASGDVSQQNIASSPIEYPLDPPLPFQVDRVTSAGPGSTFEPRHSTKGFRYVRIEGHPGPLRPQDVTGVVVHSDLTRIGAFECSDERVNRLQEIAERAFLANACEIPTDCPTRERAGWVGDWQIYVATAAELFDVDAWSRRWLRDLAADQYEDGSVTNIVPDPSPDDPAWKFTHGSAGWGDAAVHVPWELYRATGDPAVLDAQLESARRWVDFALAAAASGRHPSRVARTPEAPPHERYIWDTGWHWGEWLEPGAGIDQGTSALLAADHGCVATAYLYRSCDELAQIGSVLDRPAVADRYRELARQVLAAWRTEFLDADGHVVPGTQANLVRAVAFGLVPTDLRSLTVADLVTAIRGAGTHLGTGFLSTPYLLPVLADHGELDLAYELLFQTTYPSWLYMLDRGATTVWEDWDGVQPDGTARDSLNHYSKGAVISFHRRHIAGLQLVEPGYRTFRVAPRPGGGITSARTHHVSPQGRIEVGWRSRPEGGTIEVTVPRGTSAHVVDPSGSASTLSAGRHIVRWRDS